MSESNKPHEQRATKLFDQSKFYNPIHPEIFTFDEKFLDPSFLKASKDCKLLLEGCFGNKDTINDPNILKEFNQRRQEILSNFLTPESRNIYSCKIFTDEFCEKLLEEVINFGKTMNIQIRPNSMNNYGVVMDEMGMGPFFDKFVLEYFQPIALIMSKNQDPIDDHHTFIVEYSPSKDKDLDYHVDDSELTINLCLGKNFKGGGVYFGGIEDLPYTWNDYFEYNHVIGRAVIHDGKHQHGALPVESGERYNLIMWLRSSKYRKKKQLDKQ